MNENRNNEARQNQANGQNAQNGQTENKKVKMRFAIKPEQFQTNKGIKSLYQKTKSLKLDQFSQINVENTMKKIVTVLKSWQNQFVPKYSFDYFLQRCQVLGNHKSLTAYMSKVRKIHKGLDQWQQVQPNQVQPNQPANMNPVDDHFHENINILNGISAQQQPARGNALEVEDDEDIFELMYQAEKKAESKRENKMEQGYAAYVPEGYQNPFSQEDD